MHRQMVTMHTAVRVQFCTGVQGRPCTPDDTAAIHTAGLSIVNMHTAGHVDVEDRQAQFQEPLSRVLIAILHVLYNKNFSAF